MKRIVLGLVIALAVFSALANDNTDCFTSASPQRSENACTRYLEDKTLSNIWLANTYVRRGTVRQMQGNLSGAKEDFFAALKYNEKNANAWHMLGFIALKEEDWGKALSYSTKAIELQQYAWTYVNRALAYEKTLQKDLAIADLTKAIELDTKNETVARANRAGLYLQIGNCDAAVADATESINKNSQHARSYMIRAYCNISLKKYQPAFADLNEVIRLDPVNFDAFTQRGRLQVMFARWDEAIADNTKAIELQPKKAGLAYANRGLAHIRKGQYDKALTDLNKAIELQQKDAVTRYYLALANALQGNFDNAKSDVEDAINQRPTNAAQLYLRGLIREKLGESADAEEDKKRAVEIEPRLGEVASEQNPLEYFAKH